MPARDASKNCDARVVVVFHFVLRVIHPGGNHPRMVRMVVTAVVTILATVVSGWLQYCALFLTLAGHCGLKSLVCVLNFKCHANLKPNGNTRDFSLGIFQAFNPRTTCTVCCRHLQVITICTSCTNRTSPGSNNFKSFQETFVAKIHYKRT